MGSVNLYQYFVVDLDERVVTGGSLSRAKSITLTSSEIVDQTFIVPAATAVKIFDAVENSEIGSFDFLWLESDLDVLIQATTGVGVTDAYDVKTLAGSGTSGQMGPAMVLGSDVTQLLDGTVDLFDGTAGTLGELWAYNEDDTDSARVRIVVGA